MRKENDATLWRFCNANFKVCTVRNYRFLPL